MKPLCPLPGLVGALSLVAVAMGQQFSDGTLGQSYRGISDQCALALNTTVQGCSVVLAALAVDMPRQGRKSLDALCSAGCRSSLASVRDTIVSKCSGSKDVFEMSSVVYPATFVIDRIIYAYDMSCSKDSATGQYCDQLYLDALANGTKADSCSSCSLNAAKMQLNSPFGYHSEVAAAFQSVTSKCSAQGYAVTSPAKYALSTKTPSRPTASPTCGSPYTVQSGDSCDSIALAKNVSTYAITKAANTGADCVGLQAGAKLCLPQPCALYRVQFDDSCQKIMTAISGLRPDDLLNWNPNINALCNNMDAMAKQLICVSPPGRTLAQVTVTAQPSTTEGPPTSVPRPANAKAESNQRCAGWYEVQDGDYCQAISIRQGISMRNFYFLNPSIDQPQCRNLWLKTSYCVKAVGDINTYSGYPYSTSPAYTLTSSSFTTTSGSAVDTVKPIATPIVQLPLASGSQTTAQGCLLFANYRVVTPQRDQSQQQDKPVFSKSVNSCDFVSALYNVLLEDLLSWNPSLVKGDKCAMQPGFSYCAYHKDLKPPTATRNCIPVAKPYPGTIESCTCFTTVDGFDAGKYSCQDLAGDKQLKMSDLLAWNSWLGSEATCDQNMYNGLAASDNRPVCVWIGSVEIGGTSVVTSIPAATTTTTTTSAGPGAPTQTGIVVGCQKFYTTVKGDGCWAIANDNKITLDDFYAWNPAVGKDCANLWTGYAYCVKGPAPVSRATSTPSPTSGGGVPPPGPTQSGAANPCKKWHNVASGDGCDAIEKKYNVDFATLLRLNPGIGKNCESLWLGYSICVEA